MTECQNFEGYTRNGYGPVTVGRKQVYAQRRMSITELVTVSYNQAKEKGFHSEDAAISFGDRIALCHSELSEALEAYRATGDVSEAYLDLDTGKPEGVPSELADVVIRVADMCGVYGIDLHQAIVEKLAYNRTRPMRHGKKAL